MIPNVTEKRWDICSTTSDVDDRILPIPPDGNFLHSNHTGVADGPGTAFPLTQKSACGIENESVCWFLMSHGP